MGEDAKRTCGNGRGSGCCGCCRMGLGADGMLSQDVVSKCIT